MLADLGNMQDVRGNTVVALIGVAAIVVLLLAAMIWRRYGMALRRWSRNAPYSMLGTGAVVGWLAVYIWAAGTFPPGWLLALVMLLLVAVIIDEKLDPTGRRARRARSFELEISGGSSDSGGGAGDGGGE